MLKGAYGIRSVNCHVSFFCIRFQQPGTILTLSGNRTMLISDQRRWQRLSAETRKIYIFEVERDCTNSLQTREYTHKNSSNPKFSVMLQAAKWLGSDLHHMVHFF